MSPRARRREAARRPGGHGGIAAAAVVALLAACGSSRAAPGVTTQSDEAAEVDVTGAGDHAEHSRIAYGPDPSQFGHLSRPADPPPGKGHPVVVLIHGGFWRDEFGLDLMTPLATDLAVRGFAVWNIEYRRVGQDGGGWPGTLEDVAAAVDELATLAGPNTLDVARVAFVGHSAGGHLALWAAGRSGLPPGAPGAAPLVQPTVAVGQGPVVDLAAGDARGLGSAAVTAFLGGHASKVPERYAIATPSAVGPARLVAVRGTADGIVPAEFTLLPSGEGIEALDVEGDDHFDLIDPASASWAAVVGILVGEA